MGGGGAGPGNRAHAVSLFSPPAHPSSWTQQPGQGLEQTSLGGLRTAETKASGLLSDRSETLFCGACCSRHSLEHRWALQGVLLAPQSCPGFSAPGLL